MESAGRVAAAAGHGLVNSDVEAGRVRRLPLVAAVDRALVPTLGIEMLRLAAGEPSYTVEVTPRGVERVSVAGLTVPTESDGAVWIHYAPHAPGRFVSAGDVLDGRAPPSLFERKLVLVGVTALGLGDYHATPVSTPMSGVEIHAQLLENIFDADLLSRATSIDLEFPTGREGGWFGSSRLAAPSRSRAPSICGA